jgi:hypothetical protein
VRLAPPSLAVWGVIPACLPAFFLLAPADTLGYDAAGAQWMGRAMDDEAAAKALFDGKPHAHPKGLVPSWEIQPETIKDVFRRKVNGVRSMAEQETAAVNQPLPGSVQGPSDLANLQLINAPEWFVNGAQVLWAGNDPIILFNKIIPAVPPPPPPGMLPGTPTQSLALVAPIGMVRLSAETLKDLATALHAAVEIREKDIGKAIETDTMRQQAAAKKKR